jgi:hypothetical protein
VNRGDGEVAETGRLDAPRGTAREEAVGPSAAGAAPVQRFDH